MNERLERFQLYFVPATSTKKYGQEMLIKILILAVFSGCGLAQDDDWPPIYEPWRCLTDPDDSKVWTLEDVMLAMDEDDRQDDDCPLITQEICEEPDYYPMPCK